MAGDTRVVWGKIDGGGLFGPIWVIGWLFTVGYLHLHLIKGLLAIVVWPYFLGAGMAH
jgi:hypothetical protein